MIKSFEYKIPFELKKSFQMVVESGNEILSWESVSSDEHKGVIEWKQKGWLGGLGASRIKVYLKEPRPKDTLVTIYVSRPMLLIVPAKRCERVYKKLEEKLDVKTAQ